MFEISRADAVALCEGYGLLMASGWNRDRLTKKTAEMQRLVRSGEFPDFDELDESLQRVGRLLAEAEEFEVVRKVTEERKKEEIVEESVAVAVEESPSEVEETEVEDVEEKCVLSTGQHVLVNDEDPWKGIVTEILGPRYVTVEDGRGEIWEVEVEKCKTLKKNRRSADPQEEELQELQSRVNEAKTKSRQKKQKKTRPNRAEVVYGIVKKHEEGIDFETLVREADEQYVKLGGKSSVRATTWHVKQLTFYGTLFGMLKKEGNIIREMI